MIMITHQQLVNDLQTLGVATGDALFIHASYKSLGPVENGAADVIDALQQAVGSQGTLLMPSFNLVPHAQRAATWNIQTTPATTGYLTEFFRTRQGTVRSDHYSHSVAASGALATHYTQDHLNPQGLRSPWDKAPWGSTYGQHSPFHKAYTDNARLLFIGIDHYNSTFMHFVEVLYWNKRLQHDPDAKYFWLDRRALGQWWESQHHSHRGRVGQADCSLFSIRDYVDAILALVEQDPLPWRKTD